MRLEVLLLAFVATVYCEPFVEEQDPLLMDQEDHATEKRHHNYYCLAVSGLILNWTLAPFGEKHSQAYVKFPFLIIVSGKWWAFHSPSFHCREDKWNCKMFSRETWNVKRKTWNVKRKTCYEHSFLWFVISVIRPTSTLTSIPIFMSRWRIAQ